MTKIGAAWWKFTDKGEQYLSLNLMKNYCRLLSGNQVLLPFGKSPKIEEKAKKPRIMTLC